MSSSSPTYRFQMGMLALCPYSFSKASKTTLSIFATAVATGAGGLVIGGGCGFRNAVAGVSSARTGDGMEFSTGGLVEVAWPTAGGSVADVGSPGFSVSAAAVSTSASAASAATGF